MKAGIGATCQSVDQCQGEAVACTKLADTSPNGVCTSACTTDSDCPAGAVCSPDGNRCQAPLKIGAIYIGNSGEGWTKTHADGLVEASKALGYPQVSAAEAVNPGADTVKKVNEFIAAGSNVIIATSTSYSADLNPIAAANPDVKFLVCEGSTVTDNLGSYYGRREQAWYVAGQLAARASKSGRLGVVATFVSPDVVRNINAFLLGARTNKPGATVEVRWSGFFFDATGGQTDDGADGTGLCDNTSGSCYLEEYLADKMVANGVEVVTHQADVDLTNLYVEKYNGQHPGSPPVLSIANNNRQGCFAKGDPNGTKLASCLSAVYWNWTPLYTDLFRQMRFAEWTPANIYESLISGAEREQSIVGVQLSELGSATMNQFALNTATDAIADNPDPYSFFSGATKPYNTNDRKAGQVTGPLSEAEVLHMCWFAEGVVEPDPTRDSCSENPKSATDCMVPAKVPNGDRIPWKAVGPPGVPAAVVGVSFFSCVANGGAIN